MGRTKAVARRSPSAPPNNRGSVANNSASLDDVPQTEYYPIVLNWTVQGIQQQRKLNYRNDLEEADAIIAARLAGHFVKDEDLDWAKRVGEKERERFEAEEEAKKEALRRRWAPRPMRKIKAGKRLAAAELTFLDPDVEDSVTSLTEVSKVSDMRPASRSSPAEPEVRHVVTLDDIAPVDFSSRSRQAGEGSAENSISHSQQQDDEEEGSDDFDEEYWANEAAMWDVGSADGSVGQRGDREDGEGAEEGTN